MPTKNCPSCGSADTRLFYEVKDVPVHSVLLMPTREEALAYRRGDVRLGHCGACGFIANQAFDPTVHEYSARYEETQGFSATFNHFLRNLAVRLIAKYDLRGKDVIEIGCGKGEFLSLLCELGDNRGVGFDPSFRDDRLNGAGRDGDGANGGGGGQGGRVEFVKDFYSEKYADRAADFVCCRMTLEHIDRVHDFIRRVRRAGARKPGTVVFFQVPDVTRILQEVAFWDVYYEHCSYFGAGSLARLFRRCGFDILDVSRDYDDQYLRVEAVAGGGNGAIFPELEDDLHAVRERVAFFAGSVGQKVASWRRYLREIARSGRRAVLWGAGSKAVAFLSTIGVTDEVEYAVDINPHKQGTFLAGTGQEIVAPEMLRDYRPAVVIVMNPIYRPEIQRELARLEVRADIMSVTADLVAEVRR